jgi:hypothetical protein
MNQIEDRKVLHPVENLTHLYRARRYNTREVWLDRYEDNPFMIQLLKGTNNNEWHIYYELCEVANITPMEVIVISQDMPLVVLKHFPDFYAGGKFNINKPKLQQSGRAHHSRHGEYFYIAVPDSAIALGEGRELVGVAL